MFSNVLMTALTPLCNTDENSCWQNRPFTTIWPEDHKPISTTRSLDQPKNFELKKTIKKKKRYRTAFSTEQIQVLEKTYYRLKYINAEERKQLSETLNIGERSIKIWFQNRRMKEKREVSESSDSSTETTAFEEIIPRPEPINPIPEVQACQVPPKVEENHQYGDMYSDENQTYSKFDQFSGYPCQDFTNYHFFNQSGSQNSAPSTLLPAKQFAEDRSSYPTSYYPTLVDYYLGESYQYEPGTIDSSEMQWSANNFDLHYF